MSLDRIALGATFRGAIPPGGRPAGTELLRPDGAPSAAGLGGGRTWDRLHADLLAALKRAGKLDRGTVIVDGVTVRAFGGGEATGPSPVDRRKPGTKHTVMVNKAGVPSVLRTAGATASDCRQILPVILDSPGRDAGPPHGVAQ